MALASAMAQGYRKKPPPSNVRSKKKGKTQKSGLCGGVEGDLYGIDSCRYVLLVNQASHCCRRGGAKSGGVAKQKSAGNVGKLTQVSLLHSAPLPALWQDVAAAPYICCRMLTDAEVSYVRPDHCWQQRLPLQAL